MGVSTNVSGDGCWPTATKSAALGFSFASSGRLDLYRTCSHTRQKATYVSAMTPSNVPDCQLLLLRLRLHHRSSGGCFIHTTSPTFPIWPLVCFSRGILINRRQSRQPRSKELEHGLGHD